MATRPQSPTEPGRVVLEGVPRVGFYGGGSRCPEDFAFPSCLRAWLEFMGENYGCKHVEAPSPTRQLGCTYAYIMGTSGAAFQLTWHSERWDPAGSSIGFIAADPRQPFRRAFEAVGYECEIFGNKDMEHPADEGASCLRRYEDRDYFRTRIIESIRDKGRPVLGFGVVGPPECCIIAGYDERGQVLVGWSFFQGFPEFSDGVAFEPAGYFRKGNWYKDTAGLIVIGEKQRDPPLAETYRKALEWAIEVTRTPMVYKRYNGLAAYGAWADALVRDEAFPAHDMAVLREHHMVHNDAVGAVAEGRWYASLFLAHMAEEEPSMAEELYQAAACYAAEHDLMWQIWDLAGGISNPEAHVKLVEPDVRRQIVPVILQARDKDAQAADHIERALKK
jgi:hypothetical protein